MRIEIDDSISGPERKHILRIAPVRYALDKFNNNRTLSAKWLGICVRSLRNIINATPELHVYKYNEEIPRIDYYQELLNSLSDEQRCRYNDELEVMKSKSGWRYADQERRNLLLRKLIGKYLKEKVGDVPPT